VSGPRVRYLPRPDPCWERAADLVVVGSGAAGISAALAAARHGRQVLLITKDGLGAGATPLAQGGLAAAIGPGDSVASHHRDTVAAGAGLCEPAAVAELARAAPREITRLAALGARLDRAPLHREGGHSQSRIVHAGGDAAGAEVHRVLRAALGESRVEILGRCVALDLVTDPGGRVTGLLAGLAGDDGEDAGGLPGPGALSPGVIAARAVVLASGGFGQAFATTTNPAGLTGDGLALAARAGADLRDLEFVQFHPTVLWQPGARGACPLITEALRGAGAVLVDAAGRPVMTGQHPLGDLAPRDVVSAVMARRMSQGDSPSDHLWLDATRLGRAALERDFPTVTAACRARGIDPVSEPIPVAPGAHYACGGIVAGLDGRTRVRGLYAVGEAASTGVHGANRLASNSLTEALISGRRAGDLLGRELPGPGLGRADLDGAGLGGAGLGGAGLGGAGLGGPALDGPGLGGPGLGGAGLDGRELPPAGAGASPAGRTALAAAMSRHAGVLRDRDGLRLLLRALQQAPAGDGRLDLAVVEATSLHTVSALVTVAALARAESRGCHRWRDIPAAAGGPARHSVLRVADGEVRLVAGASWATGAEPGLADEAAGLAGRLGARA
jgi:L-aspartate oxidase